MDELDENRNLQLSKEEVNWVYSNFRYLSYRKEGLIDCIKGTLDFKAEYNPKTRIFKINPSKITNPNLFIEDSYEISLRFTKSKLSGFVEAKEIAGRILRFANKNNKDVEELHAKKNGLLCLYGPLNVSKILPDGFNLEDFFFNILIPFFYSNSFYENNERWIFGSYYHGDAGKLQNLLELTKYTEFKNYMDSENSKGKYRLLGKHLVKRNKTVRLRHNCICGKNFRICDCSCEFKNIVTTVNFHSFQKVFRKYFKFEGSNTGKIIEVKRKKKGKIVKIRKRMKRKYSNIEFEKYRPKKFRLVQKIGDSD